MVVSRIRHHVATHNWFAVGVDFLIVVAGIVIGTQVNNWNQSRIEAQEGHDYRQRLIRELQFNALQYRQQQQYYRQVLSHGLRAIAALDGRIKSTDAAFLVDAYQLSQIDTASPKTYIYDEMVSSGLVSRLGNEELQETASDYYLNVAVADRTMREIFPYRTVIRQSIPFAIQSAIRTRCGDRLVYAGKRLVGTALPERCDAGIDGVEAERAARQIMAQPGLRPEMTRYIASVDEKLNSLNLGILLTQRFIADLQSAR